MIDKELKNLQDWLALASSYELPSYKELPTVPLYMEQVTAYINKTLSPMSPKDNEILTSFMVNNYVKAKIIKEPNRKKYNEEHLGYLLAICSLKNSLTMAELSHLIALDGDVSTDKSALYGFFRVMTRSVIGTTMSLAQKRVNRFTEEYNKNRGADEEKAEQRLIDSLGLIALRMSIQASVSRAVSEALLATIEKGQSRRVYEAENKQSHHEIKHTAKASDREAERIAAAKAKSLREKRRKDKQKREEAKKEQAKQADANKEQKE